MPTRPRSHAERQPRQRGDDSAYNATRRARWGPDPRATARWRRLRLMKLARDPLCADPFGLHAGRPVPATQVDHIQGIHERPDLVWEYGNLQSLCIPCHSVKSGWERRQPHNSPDFA